MDKKSKEGATTATTMERCVPRKSYPFLILVLFVCLCVMYFRKSCDEGYALVRPQSFIGDSRRSAASALKFVENEHNMSDIEPEQESPGMEMEPNLVPPVVHYIWCGAKKFRFKDYLGVMSAIKALQPLKLVFHYTDLPQTDDYNVWFQDLKTDVAGLELEQLTSKPACGSAAMLNTALGFLSKQGGILLGENILMNPASVPINTLRKSDFWFSTSQTSDKTSGIFIATHGFDESKHKAYINVINSDKNSGCSSTDAYNHNTFCVTVPDVVYPRDIIEPRTPFAELSRWIFYGRSEPATPKQDKKNLIPRISHYVRLRGSNDGMYKDEFSFNHYLNVLSALYVAGFHRVYIHLDMEPTGHWWQEVKKENVTVVQAVKPSSVFQTSVNVVQHVSDVERYLIVYKYGGAYQDFDVTWTSYVPDSLLSYPAVTGMEWTQNDKNFPETFNLGVFMARPRAPWMRHYIQTHRDFRDKDWGYNSLRMSYRTFEKYPHLVYPDRHLQVLCCYGICHPAWEKFYVRPMSDKQPTISFRWQEVSAVHVTCPKPHASLASPDTIKNSKDMFGEIGRNVLEKSGKLHLLN